MKNIVLILVVFLSVNVLFSQTSDIQKMEYQLISKFKKYQNSDYEIRTSLRIGLRHEIETILSDSTSFEYPFDSLSKCITIIQSNNKAVRLFSWDELTGGTWHDMAVIVQFKTSTQHVKTKWIDSDICENPKGITDAIQYQIHDVVMNEQTRYLCFGSGTYGSGHHHSSILLFSISRSDFS